MIATSDTTRTQQRNLALSSAAYKRRAWIAITGLLLFFIFYVGLASWFTFIAYRLIAGVFLGGDGAFWGFLASLPAISEHLRSITGDPKRGLSPIATRERVFEERLAQPPRMWLTHPSNVEREEHAKREYVASNEDTREAWTLRPTQLLSAQRTKQHRLMLLFQRVRIPLGLIMYCPSPSPKSR
ncbi:MAG: hypothetical protein SFV81_15430 [Pirellulaceae bacterium]|nr:hypothetical protein [Pirellulaceae bacterium]